MDDTKLSCPLCGGPNQCALAIDPSATECWCDSQEFPRELLAQLPPNEVGRRCICQTCLEDYRNRSGVSGIKSKE
jgi:hypothetical protein